MALPKSHVMALLLHGSCPRCGCKSSYHNLHDHLLRRAPITPIGAHLRARILGGAMRIGRNQFVARSSMILWQFEIRRHRSYRPYISPMRRIVGLFTITQDNYCGLVAKYFMYEAAC